jgi:hypothetical protein
MRYTYRVEQTVRTRWLVDIEVSEEEAATVMHTELEQRATKAEVNPGTKTQMVDYRVDLMNRVP